MKIKVVQNIAIFWAYFIGIGAVIGSLMMFVDPSGKLWDMEPMLPLLRDGLPMFKGLLNNFIASGVVLLLVNGLTNFVSILLIHHKSPLATLSSMICGIILMGWTLFEMYIFRDIVPIIIIYFLFGLLQMLTGFWLMKISKKTTPNT